MEFLDRLLNGDYNDVIGGIIGGISGWNGGQDQTTKPYMVQGQEAALKEGIQGARDQYAGGPLPYYPDQTVADLNPNLRQGWNDQLGSTDRLQQLADQGGSSALTLAKGGDKVGGFTLQDQIGFGIPEQYQNAIMDPIMRNLNERIIPGIHTAAQSQGAFGGSRMQQQKSDAATQATKEATDAMIMGNLNARGQSIGQRAGDISAQLSGRGQDISQNAQQASNMYNGINSLNTAMGQQLMPGQTMANVGLAQMQDDQTRLDSDINRFNWNRDEYTNNVDRLLNRMSGNVAPTGGSTVQGTGGGVWDALTGFMSGSNIYNNAMKTPNPADALQPVSVTATKLNTNY
jgi:hypothetical protein